MLAYEVLSDLGSGWVVMTVVERDGDLLAMFKVFYKPTSAKILNAWRVLYSRARFGEDAA